MRENIESPPPSSPEPKPKAETRERDRARNRARKSPYAAAVANRMHLIDLARVYGFEHLTIKSLDLPVLHLDDPGLPPEPEKPKPEPKRKYSGRTRRAAEQLQSLEAGGSGGALLFRSSASVAHAAATTPLASAIPSPESLSSLSAARRSGRISASSTFRNKHSGRLARATAHRRSPRGAD